MKNLISRVVDYLYQKWITSGWKLIVGVVLALVAAWYAHPYLAILAYQQGWASVYDNSWVIAFLVAVWGVFSLGILGMMWSILFGMAKIGKTKFKRKQ